MIKSISSHIDGGGIKLKKKKSPKKSPNSQEYQRFLEKKSSAKKLNEIKINIVKKDNTSVKKDNTSVKKDNTSVKKDNTSVKKDNKQVKGKSPSIIVNNNKRGGRYHRKKSPKRVSFSPKVKESKIEARSNKKRSLKNKRRPSRTNRRQPSKKRSLNKKHTKSRRISFNCYSNNSKSLDKTINDANKLSENKMRENLQRNGISIKSKNKKLLKDLYIFSNMGGITVNKE